MLICFLAKRTIVPVLICAAVFFMYGALGPVASVGTFLGAVLSLYKISLLEKSLKAFAANDGAGKNHIFFQIISLSLLLTVLTAAIIADLRLFVGVTAGLLSVPFVIGVNAITEGLGLTRNGWGDEPDEAP